MSVSAHRARLGRALVCAIASAVAAPGSAAADGPIETLGDPRAVARAGAVVVSGDSGLALLINPAGVARRGGKRIWVGGALRDTDTSFDASGAVDSPTSVDRAGPVSTPMLSAAFGLGQRVVVGGFVAETADRVTELPSPRTGEPAEAIERLFPHRYAGLSTRYQRRMIGVGGAFRAGETVAIGASLHLSQERLSERRRVWAGFGTRDRIGDASRDLDLLIDATSGPVFGGTVGALIAPIDVPIELAAALSIRSRAKFDGGALLSRTQGADFPSVARGNGQSAAELAPLLTGRTGARYLGERFAVEIAAQITVTAGDDSQRWQLQDVTAIDQSSATGSLESTAMLYTRRDHASVSGNVELQAVEGFLWLSVGYGFRGTPIASSRVSPGHADLTNHTLSFGAEAVWDALTLTIGYARSLSAERTIEAAGSDIVLENPFDAGSSAAAAGRYDASVDSFGLAVEYSWE